MPLQGQESSEGSSITAVPRRGDQMHGLFCSLLPWCHPKQLFSFSPSDQGLPHPWLRGSEEQSVLWPWVSRRQHIFCPGPQAWWWAFSVKVLGICVATAVHPSLPAMWVWQVHSPASPSSSGIQGWMIYAFMLGASSLLPPPNKIIMQHFSSEPAVTPRLAASSEPYLM